jgi:hypothetical protein
LGLTGPDQARGLVDGVLQQRVGGIGDADLEHREEEGKERGREHRELERGRAARIPQKTVPRSHPVGDPPSHGSRNPPMKARLLQYSRENVFDLFPLTLTRGDHYQIECAAKLSQIRSIRIYVKFYLLLLIHRGGVGRKVGATQGPTRAAFGEPIR